jgi:catechol 2,3-dioxygenase-like lactoylglutathione lyase family enzyme
MTAFAFDHVAIAVQRWNVAGPVLAGVLGGRWGHGAHLPHMSVCQVLYGNDTRVELLAPGSSPDSFVRTFLDRGQGASRPHHLTFRVSDIGKTLAAASAHGVEPVLVDLSHELRKEAFLHPKDTGLGFLVQFVESSLDMAEIAELSDVPAPWDDPTDGPPARLDYVLAEVPDLTTQRAVLADVLGGTEEEPPMPPGRRAARFTWAEGADVILVEEPGLPRARHGVRSLGVTTERPLPFVTTPAGGGHVETPVIPELGLSLMTRPAPATGSPRSPRSAR